jgi:hypothetical protein
MTGQAIEEVTPPASSPPVPQTDAERTADGRWAAQNSGAKSHGLRSTAKAELRRRDRRTARLFQKFVEARADGGRALSASQLLLGRRYCELANMSTDLYSVWLLRPSSDPGVHQRYISTVRAMALYASLLGETPASQAMLRNQAGANSSSLAARLARLQLEPHDDEAEEEAG